jgi:integrase
VVIDELSKYREKWTLAPGTARTKIGLLRAFFHFCVDRGWIEKNPALLLKHPRAVHKPALPVSDEDFEKLLRATEHFPVGGAHKERTGERLKAFILTLRYSGLRIQDCALLKREKLRDGRIFLHSQKTGVPVWVPIPEFVVKELEKLDGEYFFWSGQGLVKTALGNWQRSLERLGKIAGVKFHAHQL